MRGFRKKYIIFIILAIILTGGAIGFYMFNKGPVDVKSAPATKVTATELYQVFAKDSVLARQQYSDRILEVSGLVKRVSKNQQNQVIVMLQTNEDGAYVNCTLEDDDNSLAENTQATLKGICTGMGMGEPDLGIPGDVYLVRCYQKK